MQGLVQMGKVIHQNGSERGRQSMRQESLKKKKDRYRGTEETKIKREYKRQVEKNEGVREKLIKTGSKKGNMSQRSHGRQDNLLS